MASSIPFAVRGKDGANYYLGLPPLLQNVHQSLEN